MTMPRWLAVSFLAIGLVGGSCAGSDERPSGTGGSVQGSSGGAGGGGGAKASGGATGSGGAASGGSGGGSAGSSGSGGATASGGTTGSGGSSGFGGTTSSGGSGGSAAKDASADAPAGTSVDVGQMSGGDLWSKCGPEAYKAGVSAADFCARYISVCKATVSMDACMAMYNGLSDGPQKCRACTAYYACIAGSPEVMAMSCLYVSQGLAKNGPCKPSYCD
jgi:hypothetical protein